MNYLHWNEKTITDFSPENVSAMYADGYVFTRIGKGVMHQTRSVRIDLSKFDLTSENRRVLKKTDTISINETALPMADYDFKIGKLAKDFYEEKFGPGIMSAQKVKEMLTDGSKSNFNKLLRYTIYGIIANADSETHPQATPNAPEIPQHSSVGYTICYSSNQLLHYSYPFYDLTAAPKDMGLGMMLMAIEYAKSAGMKHVYLGSLQRPTDTYKLQFEGLEWFDGKKWNTDIEEVKKLLKASAQ